MGFRDCRAGLDWGISFFLWKEVGGGLIKSFRSRRARVIGLEGAEARKSLEGKFDVDCKRWIECG